MPQKGRAAAVTEKPGKYGSRLLGGPQWTIWKYLEKFISHLEFRVKNEKSMFAK